MHNRAEGTYISVASIPRSHSKKFLCKIHKMECSTGYEWIYFEDLSFWEMLAVPFIFSVEWVDG